MEIRSVFYIIGMLISTLGCTMAVPGIIDFIAKNSDWSVFASTGLIIFFLGITLSLAFKNKNLQIGTKETFLLTFLAWIFLCGISALPFYLSSVNLSYTDAFFEATSGLTTAGSTVLVDIEDATSGTLIWRSILQWLGGIGIIVMAVAALPLLHISGLQIFFSEQTERPDKIKERVKNIASSIIFVYLFLTITWTIMLNIAGMSLFDSICHAMTTIATGGFSTKNGSIGHFQNIYIEIIIIFGMILASLPFILYIKKISNNKISILQDQQVRLFLIIILVSITIIALWLNITKDLPLITAIRLSSFNAISIMTGTGYSTVDFTLWGSFTTSFLFILMFIGGCTGSTTGGLKIFRILIISKIIFQQIKKIIRPHQVIKINYSKASIDERTTLSILALSFLFLISTFIITALLCMTGLDTTTALSAAATALAVVGPGLTTEIGPTGNFSSLSDQAKWILAISMIIGRIEFFALMVLLLPSFWKR